MKKFLIIFFCSIFFLKAESSYFNFEEIKTPFNLDAQVGGLSITPSGKLVACFHRGEVMIYDFKTKQWSKFAEGLHEPLGIVAISDKEFIVMQRPELTSIKDTDGDGIADFYKTVSDDFGMSGNYHEFAFGPALDKDGNYWVGLNVASNGAPIRKEIRGEFSKIGLERDKFYEAWGKNRRLAGRMYARVPYRGWILKISKEGKVTPWACGVRSPNGLGFDAEGNLFVTDNQGDWLGTSKLHHIQKDHFHGHPASLIWRKGWTENPLKVPVEELDKIRTKAALLMPQGELANSPTQPLLIDHEKFGPFKGQMLIGEMCFKRILRYMPDKVNGKMQGAVVSFIESPKMKIGNNRLVWTPEGDLIVGRTKLSWAGDRGLSKVSLNKTIFDIQNVKLSHEGFIVSFTHPLKDSLNKKHLEISSYTYTYHKNYGSPQKEMQKHEPIEIKPLKDNKSYLIKLGNVKKNFVYQVKMKNIKSAKMMKLNSPAFYYTVNEVPQK